MRTIVPATIFLKAIEAKNSLRKAVEEESKKLNGDLNKQGAIIIVDGADEVGTNEGIKLLDEARFLSEIWANTFFLITSRPTPVTQVEEAIIMPNLIDAESYALIGKIAGTTVTYPMRHNWPKSLQDAIKRPLFCILLGHYLKEREMRIPQSTGELLVYLIDKSLPTVNEDSEVTHSLLQHLAMLITDRGGNAVPKSEIGFGGEIRTLLDSRLVIENSGSLSFALPLFTQWFAAHALLTGLKDINEIITSKSTSDHWFYALVILISNFGHEKVFPIFSSLTKNDPGFASRIIAEGLAKWGLSEDVLPPPPIECGKRIYSTMESWVQGFGPLAQFIAPIQSGKVRPIVSKNANAGLVTSWYNGKEERLKMLPCYQIHNYVLMNGHLLNSQEQVDNQHGHGSGV